MLVDSSKYKKLISEAEKVYLKGINWLVTIEYGTGFKKGDVCRICITSNGIYLTRPFCGKEYININTINKTVITGDVLRLYDSNDMNVAWLKFSNENQLYFAHNSLCELLGLPRNKRDLKQIKERNKKEKRIKQAREYEKSRQCKEERKLAEDEKKKEMERLRNVGRTVSPYEEPNYQPVQDDNVARCPKCGSTSLTANKKGFSATKGVIGLAVSPLAGAVVGSTGKNKVIVTCLRCGHQWKAGKK